MTKQGSWGVAPDSAGPLGLENYTSKVARGHRPESYLSANPTARQLPGISGNHQSAAKPVSISLQVGGQAWMTRLHTSVGRAGGLVGGAPPRARDARAAGTLPLPPGLDLDIPDGPSAPRVIDTPYLGAWRPDGASDGHVHEPAKLGTALMAKSAPGHDARDPFIPRLSSHGSPDNM